MESEKVDKIETEIDPYVNNISKNISSIVNYVARKDKFHQNSPAKWFKDWKDYLRSSGGSLQEMCEELNYTELVDLVMFELIEKMIEAKRLNLYQHTRLPYLYLNLIREHYNVSIESGKGDLFTKMGKLTWNDIEKAIRTKEEQIKKDREDMIKRFEKRRLAAKEKDRDEIWEENRKQEESYPFIEEEE